MTKEKKETQSKKNAGRKVVRKTPANSSKKQTTKQSSSSKKEKPQQTKSDKRMSLTELSVPDKEDVDILKNKSANYVIGWNRVKKNQPHNRNE